MTKQAINFYDDCILIYQYDLHIYIHTQNNEDHYDVCHVDRVDAVFLTFIYIYIHRTMRTIMMYIMLTG